MGSQKSIEVAEITVCNYFVGFPRITGKSIFDFFSASSMRAAVFASGSTSGKRGLPTLKPILLSAYFTGCGLDTRNKDVNSGKRLA
jgi:hypothetical protein